MAFCSFGFVLFHFLVDAALLSFEGSQCFSFSVVETLADVDGAFHIASRLQFLVELKVNF